MLFHSVSSMQEKPGIAAQGSFALMGDSRPYSLVFCHAHSAQIPEDRFGHPRTPLLSALGGEYEGRKRFVSPGNCSLSAERDKKLSDSALRQ
jgi:hypothetical protein